MKRSQSNWRGVGIWIDSPERYGLISRALHWGMAYLLIWQFVIILAWRIFGESDLLKTITGLGPYHRTVGLLTIILVITRACWVLVNRNRRPRHAAGWPGPVALAAHVTFYVLMFAIPALAILRSYGNGKGWAQWGIEIVPATGLQIGWMIAPADVLHGLLSWLLCILIAGHIAIALVHGLVLKDNVLSRMVGPLRLRSTICRKSSTVSKDSAMGRIEKPGKQQAR